MMSASERVHQGKLTNDVVFPSNLLLLHRCSSPFPPYFFARISIKSSKTNPYISRKSVFYYTRTIDANTPLIRVLLELSKEFSNIYKVF